MIKVHAWDPRCVCAGQHVGGMAGIAQVVGSGVAPT